MASTIQIKRGTGSAVPTGLADGELAINLDKGQLYFGSGSTSVNSFTFKNLTAENYIISSSVTHLTTQTLSGSTTFGDDAVDVHNRTGSFNISGALTVGKDDVGHDVKFYGALPGRVLHWDESENKLSVPTLDVSLNINGSGTIQGTTITATTAFVPDTQDGASLGTDSLQFSDVYLADGGKLSFGDDNETSLTHVHNVGLLLNTSRQLQFRDNGINLQSPSDGHFEINSDTTLDITAPTVDINASTEVTIDTDTLTISSANATDPLVTIKNTTNDADGARLRFVKDKGAAGADNDVVGLIEFYADDDGQNQTAFAKIEGIVQDASDGAEEGKLTLNVASHDGEMKTGLIVASGDAEDEVDVTIGAGANSLTTIEGNIKFRGLDTSEAALHYVHFQKSGHEETNITNGFSFNPSSDVLTIGGILNVQGQAGTLFCSSDLILSSSTDVIIGAAGGNVEFKDAGTLQLTLDMDGTAGAQVIQLGVDGDDLIFKQYDGNTVLTLNDNSLVYVEEDLKVGDDVWLSSDSAKLSFGNSVDNVTLTHVADTGLLLNSTMKLQFNDASQFIHAPSATVLDIGATDEIELTATLIDVVGNLDVSGDIDLAGNIDVDGTTNLDAVDIDGNVQLDGTFTVGVDDTGYDVTLFGATSLRKAVWDASQDHLKLYDNTKLVLGTGAAAAGFDSSLYHDGSNLYLTNTTGDIILSDTTVKITAGTAGDANLILQSDTDDSNEADNPFMLLEQDGGAIRSIIGHAGANDEYPDATVFTGGLSNHLIIAHSGSGASRGMQFGTGNNARVTINTDGEVGIGNNDPGKTLDVTGEIRASGNITANGNILGDGATQVTGIDLLKGTTDDVLDIKSDSDIIYTTDDDGDEAGQHIFKERTTTLLTLDETQAAFTVPIASSGTIQAGWHGSTTRIKILVSDFIPDDIGRPAMIDDTGSDRWLESHGTGVLFASIPIPTGFKATHVRIYGSGTSAMEVSEMNINSKTVTSKGTGNIGTELDITDVTSSTTNYLFIELAQASGEEVYGGYVTIEAV